MQDIQFGPNVFRVRSLVYTVPSDTLPHVAYTVTCDPADPAMPVACTCPHHTHRQAFCKHMARVFRGDAGKPRVRLAVRDVRRPAPLGQEAISDLYPA